MKKIVVYIYIYIYKGSMQNKIIALGEIKKDVQLTGVIGKNGQND